MSDFKFAAFIMTYERPKILESTINSLLTQTYAPEKILIVDNSETSETKKLIEQISNERIVYYRMDYNAGPAGAAKIGLQQLTGEGYQWIYWGDDDDPPNFQSSFERLFEIIDSCKLPVGIIGEVGQYFNTIKGELLRVTDDELLKNEYLIVNSVAGNQSMIVNAELVRKGVLPDDSLFFGFEELDFCLRVQKAGFYVIAHCKLMNEARNLYNRLGFKKPLYLKKINLKREYYSTRNNLTLLIKNRYFIALSYQLIKNVLKSLYGFRFGPAYGFTNFKYIHFGIIHAFIGKLGKVY